MHTATNKGRVPKKFLPTSMSGTQLSCFFGPKFGLNWQMTQKSQAAMPKHIYNPIMAMGFSAMSTFQVNIAVMEVVDTFGLSIPVSILYSILFCII